MPRKTLALISVLVIVTVILFIVALRTGEKTTQPNSQAVGQISPVPTSVAHSVLSLSPNPVLVQSGQPGQVDVVINTSDNAVTAIQLEIAYDPNIISNVKVTSGSLFSNAVTLIDKNRIQEGRYTYALGISPSSSTINGQGNVATISFVTKNVTATQSQLALLPTTLVTARGVASSVLKSATGTLITVSANSGIKTSK
jgi:hypothetical protein